MNKIYEQALSEYLSQKEKSDSIRAEKKSLLQCAVDEVKAAEAAMKKALSIYDKTGYKKALKQKREAEADELFYGDLLSQPEARDPSEKDKAENTLAIIMRETEAVRSASEKAVNEKFLELYRLVIEYQLELKELLWSKNAYKIELLGEDRSTYEAWQRSLQPRNFQNIFETARSYAALDPTMKDRIEEITAEIEGIRASERSKWGWIGGRTPSDL